MSPASAAKVIAYVSFGDPYPVWASGKKFPSIPSNAKQITFCESAPTDPLCGSLLSGWPTTATGVIDHLKKIWSNVDQAKMNSAQKSALASMIVQLPLQASKQLSTLASDIKNGHLQRWMLSPQHFWYGLDGSTTKAAEQVVAALNGSKKK
jgi:cutinase